MQMRQIEAFQAVMISGGITAGATMLHISQPSVSRLIGDLERAVGFQLFERRGRRLVPTERALTFYDAVRQCYTGLELLDQAARRIRAHPVGTIRLAALPALAGAILPQAIQSFQNQYPDIKVTVESHTQRYIEDRVFLGQVDLGMGLQPPANDSIRTSPLALAEYVCVLPAGHRLAEREILHVADLAGENLVGPMHEADALWDGIDRLLLSEGVTLKRLIETQNSYPAYCFAEAGFGVLIAEPFTAPLFARLGLVIRRLRPTLAVHFSIMEPARRSTPAVIDTLRDCILRATADCLAEVERLTAPRHAPG